MRIPLDLLVGRPPEETEGKSYPEYVEKLRESLETIHELTRDRQQSASQPGMKTRYEQNSFSRGDLVWLHNTQRKKGRSPKLRSRGRAHMVSWTA